MKIGVLTNTRAGGGRSDAADVLAMLGTRPEVPSEAPTDVEGVPAALQRLADQGVEVLVVNGGDGTLQRALTEILRNDFFERIPFVAPLRTGRTNMAALDLGAARDAVAAMQQLLADAESGAIDTRIVDRAVLRVAFEPDGLVEYGVFCGLGLIHRAIGATHRAFPQGRSQGVLGSGVMTGTLLLRMISGLGGEIIAPDEYEIAIDGEPFEHRTLRLCILSTLDRLFLKLRPFWGEEDGPVRITTLGRRVLSNPVRVVRALRGVRPVAPRRDNEFYSRNAGRVDIRLDCGLTIDGELFEPIPGREISVTADERVRFVRV